MIPNHARFLEAIHGCKQVSIRFYSKADDGAIDRVCLPIDYGPGGEVGDGLNRYWVWDDGKTTGSHTLGLLPQQIMDLQVLGLDFDPAQVETGSRPWSVPRNWNSQLPVDSSPANGTSPEIAIVAARGAIGNPAAT